MTDRCQFQSRSCDSPGCLFHLAVYFALWVALMQIGDKVVEIEKRLPPAVADSVRAK